MLTLDKSLKLILLIRNPLSVLYSWYKAPREFKIKSGWNLENEWLDAPSKNLDRAEEFNGYNKWKEATLMFHELESKYPNKVRLITYSNLLVNTYTEIENLFQFSDLDFPVETKDFIKLSKSIHNEDAYSVYKTKRKDDDWNNLPASIIKQIKDDLKDTSLEIYLNE